MGHTPRVMSSEWVFRKLVLPLSGVGLDSDLVEKMLATKGALALWVASIPEHIAAAQTAIKKEQEAKKEAQRLREQKAAEALLIKDEDTLIEDLDLTVRAYNTLKRMGINTVRDILSPERSRQEIELATHHLRSGRLEHDLYLYRRLVAGGIKEDRIPSWVPHP